MSKQLVQWGLSAGLPPCKDIHIPDNPITDMATLAGYELASHRDQYLRFIKVMPPRKMAIPGAADETPRPSPETILTRQMPTAGPEQHATWAMFVRQPAHRHALDKIDLRPTPTRAEWISLHRNIR